MFDPSSPPRLEPPAFGAEARTRLLAWFEARARDLPWRRDRTPYRVWVAEIMLQQTRVATAAPYYERWMARFPTLESLAAARPDTVLAMWEGLGYYRRARSLHAAARLVVHERGGRLPASEAAWRDLPGVGPYTAAAVAAFALGTRTVAVDGNVRRLGARLTADLAPRDERLRELLLPLVPSDDAPGRGVEALIELGATVCTPRAPSCGTCPLAPECRGRLQDPTRYPAPRARKAPPLRRRYARVHVRDGALWLVRRPEEGFLGGLWGPPQQVARPPGRELPAVGQAYSHFRLELVPVVMPGPATGEGRWVGPAELADLPLSNVDRAVVRGLRGAGLLGFGA